jgi:hypothetical protein
MIIRQPLTKIFIIIRLVKAMFESAGFQLSDIEYCDKKAKRQLCVVKVTREIKYSGTGFLIYGKMN